MKKMKVKKKLQKKLLFIVMLVIVLCNCFSIIFESNVGFATALDSTDRENLKTQIEETKNGETKTTALDAAAKDEASKNMIIGLEGFMSGLVYILTIIPRLFLLLIGFFIKIIMNACVSLGTASITDVTFEHVFFSGYSGTKFSGLEFTDVNFFDLTGSGTILSFRTAVAKWYYVMRLISAAILLVILIYVGIRMALSTIASEQAKYKQMLTDWITSLALLFLLHYIIIFVIQVNNSLVSALGGMLNLKSGQTVGSRLNSQLVGDIWSDGVNGIFAALMYAMIAGSAFGFFLFYLKRMITVGFLIIIAPLITITYSIDKIGDGKAQALNAWLKELTYNILIQPFHCIIYLAFFGAMSDIIGDSSYGNISAYILAYIILKFMKEAEGILRKIFHFEANSMPGISEPAKGFAAASGKFAQIGMKGVGAFSNFKAAGGVKAFTGGFRNIGAKKDVKAAFNSGEIKTDAKTFEQFKKTDEYAKELDKKKTAREMKSRKNSRRTEKARKIYEKQNPGKSYDQMIEDEARKAYDEKHEAGAYEKMKKKARERDASGRPTEEAKMAQQTIDNQRAKTKEAKNSSIIGSTGIRKTINGAKTVAGNLVNSEGGKALGAYMKDSAKVASALALGAYAYGVTGNLTDATLFGQLGYGMAYGALEGTTKTATEDTKGLVQQYAHNNNLSPEDMKKMIQELVNECHSMDFAGMFKKIHDDQVKATEELKKILGDSANEVMAKMIGKTKVGEEYDISALIDQYSTRNLSDDEKTNAESIVKDFSDLLIKSQIAAQFNVVKAGGMDVDSFGRKVTNNYNVTESKTDYIYNYEENRYENKFEVNQSEARRRGTQTNT